MKINNTHQSQDFYRLLVIPMLMQFSKMLASSSSSEGSLSMISFCSRFGSFGISDGSGMAGTGELLLLGIPARMHSCRRACSDSSESSLKDENGERRKWLLSASPSSSEMFKSSAQRKKQIKKEV
jgi:hypothetical protein